MTSERFSMTPSEGKRSRFGSLILQMYGVSSGVCRNALRRLMLRLEGGPMYSITVREALSKYHGINVGLYTLGPCETGAGTLGVGTTIGRYSSVYYTVRTITYDNPMNTRATHGLFWDSALGEKNSCENPVGKLRIGNDVWIGHNAIILASTGEIGDGAVIGAGSVVHNKVPPYAIVTGNPARVVRFRFSEKKILELLDSEWWNHPVSSLRQEIGEFQKPLEENLPR